MIYTIRCLASAFLVLFAPFQTASAAWQPDGTALCTETSLQDYPVVVSDGAGGAIVAWYEFRNGNYDVYVQRIDAMGSALWTADGVALCTAVNGQGPPEIISDGAGGAIVAWHDGRGGVNTEDIYVGRVDALGNIMWAANGVPLCAATNKQWYPMLVSDGAGGAVVTWQDFRNGANFDIYAGRIDGSGNALWTPDGVAISTTGYTQELPMIASDGAGGAIVAWEEHRGATGSDIFARRVDAAGNALWTVNGVALCTAAHDQLNPVLGPDGAGGVIVAWRDFRSGTDWDIFTGRLDASGNVLWPSNGVALCAAIRNQKDPAIISDDAGGAIVTWMDFRSGTSYDIYAGRIDGSGSALWSTDGVALCTAAGIQQYPVIVSDGVGGAIVTWEDNRNFPVPYVYGRRINAAGSSLWNVSGVAVCAEASFQLVPAIAPVGAGRAIVAWVDHRNGNGDIFAQRIEPRYGATGRPEPVIASVADIPGDQGSKVEINWIASGWDVADQQTITHYSIWRATEVIPAAGGDEYYWELIGTLDAGHLETYSFEAPTTGDSTGQDPSLHQFYASAQTSDPGVFFDSGVAVGHSVDNLAPAVPLMLTAERAGPDVQVRWNRVVVPDLRDYAVYRADSPDVAPVPVHFLASTNDTVLVDPGAPASTLYYIVTAFDIHENQSPPSNVASVGTPTGVRHAPPITALTVLQNHPNPFAGSTEFEIGLPADSDVEIAVYDVAGRRVRKLTLARQTKGWRSVAFDGRDENGRSLASGVYFFRVKASGTTTVRKAVITR